MVDSTNQSKICGVGAGVKKKVGCLRVYFSCDGLHMLISNIKMSDSHYLYRL